jgi:hypothetical protein
MRLHCPVPAAARLTRVRSAQPDTGLNQPVEPFGAPQQGGTGQAVQLDLMPAVQQDVAELRETALDETALEEAELAQRAESIVVAQRYQRAEIAVAKVR